MEAHLRGEHGHPQRSEQDLSGTEAPHPAQIIDNHEEHTIMRKLALVLSLCIVGIAACSKESPPPPPPAPKAQAPAPAPAPAPPAADKPAPISVAMISLGK